MNSSSTINIVEKYFHEQLLKHGYEIRHEYLQSGVHLKSTYEDYETSSSFDLHPIVYHNNHRKLHKTDAIVASYINGCYSFKECRNKTEPGEIITGFHRLINSNCLTILHEFRNVLTCIDCMQNDIDNVYLPSVLFVLSHIEGPEPSREYIHGILGVGEGILDSKFRTMYLNDQKYGKVTFEDEEKESECCPTDTVFYKDEDSPDEDSDSSDEDSDSSDEDSDSSDEEPIMTRSSGTKSKKSMDNKRKSKRSRKNS